MCMSRIPDVQDTGLENEDCSGEVLNRRTLRIRVLRRRVLVECSGRPCYPDGNGDERDEYL